VNLAKVSFTTGQNINKRIGLKEMLGQVPSIAVQDRSSRTKGLKVD
jgi:hypothetical protein